MLTLTLILTDCTKVCCAFEDPASAFDKERLKKDVESKTGVSVHIERVKEISNKDKGSSGDRKQRKKKKNKAKTKKTKKKKTMGKPKKTFIVITCLASDKNRLISYSPDLKSIYPTFGRARQVYLKKYKPPEDSKLIQFRFMDALSDWGGGRAMELIADIAKHIGLREETMDLVDIRSGSVLIVFRVPEAVAQIILTKELELKAKFPTLEKIELIGDLAPLPQSVSFTHTQHDNICDTHTSTQVMADEASSDFKVRETIQSAIEIVMISHVQTCIAIFLHTLLACTFRAFCIGIV